MSALDSLQIASPCPVKFSDMKGDERKRFCEQCRQNVYNLSRLTEAEAVRLVTLSEQRICVTFLRRLDGTVITSDCKGGFAQAFAERFQQRRRPGVVAMVGAAVVAFLFATAITLFGDNLRALFGQSTGGLAGDTQVTKRPPELRTTGKLASTWTQDTSPY